MTKQEILAFLQKKKPYLREEYGVLSIGLLGSYAEGTQGSESDVDLYVELSEPRFDFLAGLQLYLEDKIGKPIELVRKRSTLSNRFLKRIETQIQYV